jgi:dihydrodipicolinate synthase/N-acetylneuraminate lyase
VTESTDVTGSAEAAEAGPPGGGERRRDLARRIRPRRPIVAMSAVLLPFTVDGAIDWDGFEAHLSRTVEAGIVPAVNMDTGFGPSLSTAERAEVLSRTTPLAPDGFVAGALVDDRPGDELDHDAYATAMAGIAGAGGTPIVFPSHGLAAVPEGDLVEAHARLATGVDRFLGFELGSMFHPAGRIWSLETFEAMLEIGPLAGAKHSSLRRGPELDRLDVRDRVRPDFLVLTGNDLAIDQVVYGSDYLLGLSTFAPDAFARRDQAWAEGDQVTFWELNDLLQYLGQLAFRSPVPGYRHDAALFLELRGWIGTSRTHPASPTRPDADRALLADIATRLEALLDDVARTWSTA